MHVQWLAKTTCMDRKPKVNLTNLDFKVTLTDQDMSLIRTPH